MKEWLHQLPIPWLALIVLGMTYLITGAIHAAVGALAKGERARWMKAVSPGMLPPLCVLFGLLIAFVASQVWGDYDRAHAAVQREASALRAVVLLADVFPPETRAQLQALVAGHIHEAVTQEWPAMAQQEATLNMIATPLAEGLRATLAFAPRGDGQVAAQRELVGAFQTALEARRQRIILSGSKVNWVKWAGLVLEAALSLVAIAFVHCDNRKTTALALAVFATAAAVVAILILAHDRPFTGQLAVRPDVLLQVMPEVRR
jgi:hypothetical protein